MENIDVAKKVFLEIQNEFPKIVMELNENDNSVELNMDIQKQTGIKHKINLNLQNNDELHFLVSNFWCEWFPCTEASVVESYKNSVIGYINGSYRILEHFKGKSPYKAELQSPNGESWSTIKKWGQLSWPISFNRSKVVIKNA